MRNRSTESTQRRREDDRLEDAATLFMLNCYDVWSATPISASGFDCAGNSDAPVD